MLDGPSVVAAFKACGITHVVWIPDSELGTWEPALLAEPSLTLLRTTREGEAIVLAAGLHLGGKRPVVLIQCTGFFEAGDALRNAVHDMKLPLFLVVGVRSYYAHQEGKTVDTCPTFTEPVVRAWNISHVLFDKQHTADDLADEYRKAQAQKRAAIVLLAE
jgi:sulfopyruvate decarboxylase TPP-binding subunit